ncbi:MAG: hypothetical protein WBM28_03075, partial [Burkholderiales bacterium]
MTAIAVVAALVWVAIAYQIRSAREDALDSARRNGDNLSGVVAENFSSFARTIDLRLQHFRGEWTDDRAHFADTMAEEKELMKKASISQIGVIDARGWSIYQDSSPSRERVFVGDRDYFKVHRETGLDRLYIGNPVKGRISGKVLIQFSRPMYGKKGEFSGVIALF